MNGVRIGFTQRAKPKMQILKGYDPQNPRLKQDALPVASGVTVVSGQLVQKKKNALTGAYEFVLAGTSGAVGVPAFAIDDSANFDVAASRLAALPVDGDYEVRTAHYVGELGALTVGTKLTFDNTGAVKAATAGDIVIGEVTGDIDSPFDMKGENNTGSNAKVVQLKTLAPYKFPAA